MKTNVKILVCLILLQVFSFNLFVVDVFAVDQYLNKNFPLKELSFDGVNSFSEGLAMVSINNKIGYIDKTGKVVIEPQFDGGFAFNDGLASVCIKETNGITDGTTDETTNGSEYKYGYIDKTGKMVIKPQFQWSIKFSEGLAGVRRLNPDDGTYGKWGFIDKTGKLVIDYQFDAVGDFGDGLVGVVKNDKLLFIDKNGSVVIDPGIDAPGEKYKRGVPICFTDGIAVIEKNGKSGAIDKTGKVVINLQYDWFYGFNEGLAAVEKDGKFGFIDKTGKVIIDYQYESANNFDKGIALVEKNGKKYFIDKTGKVVMEPKMFVISYSEGLIDIGINGKFGFIDKEGKVVIEPQFDLIYDGFKDGIALASKNGKYYIITDCRLKVRLDQKYLDFDVPPTIIDGRTLVPLRKIFEELGAEIIWDGNTKTVTATKGASSIKVKINDKNAFVNDKQLKLDVPAKIINGRTLVPVRFISESLGCNVTWDQETHTVNIAK